MKRKKKGDYLHPGQVCSQQGASQQKLGRCHVSYKSLEPWCLPFANGENSIVPQACHFYDSLLYFASDSSQIQRKENTSGRENSLGNVPNSQETRKEWCERDIDRGKKKKGVQEQGWPKTCCLALRSDHLPPFKTLFFKYVFNICLNERLSSACEKDRRKFVHCPNLAPTSNLTYNSAKQRFHGNQNPATPHGSPPPSHPILPIICCSLTCTLGPLHPENTSLETVWGPVITVIGIITV